MGLADVVTQMVGPDVPIEFTAYDGSKSGAVGAPVRLEIRSPLALSHLASAPGELGLARAYVSGALDVVGDVYTALASLPELTFAEIPTIVVATTRAGNERVFAGCYVLRRSNVRDNGWRIYRADISSIPATARVTRMLALGCRKMP